MKSKGVEDNDEPTANGDARGSAFVDLSEEDLMEVMAEFASMSEEEMEEAFAEVIAMVGGEDDPDILASVAELKEAVKTMDKSAVKDLMTEATDSLNEAVEVKIVEAADSSLEMLASADWDLVYNKRGDILASLIAHGKVTSQEAAVYKSDDTAWEKELRFIWDGLQALAEGGSAGAMEEL